MLEFDNGHLAFTYDTKVELKTDEERVKLQDVIERMFEDKDAESVETFVDFMENFIELMNDDS